MMRPKINRNPPKQPEEPKRPRKAKKPPSKKITKTVKRPRKLGRDNLTKQDKIDIIIEVMTDNPGLKIRRGCNKALIDHFAEAPYFIKVDSGYMSRLVKEVKQRLSRDKGYIYAKNEYVRQHDRLGVTLKETQDVLVKKLSKTRKAEVMVRLSNAIAGNVRTQDANFEKMEKLEGHLKDVHVFERGDEAEGKAIEDFWNEKTKGKGKGTKEAS